MKKTVLIIFGLAMASTVAEARYVRKVKEPDFFIPAEYKMHQSEKLPKIVKKTKKNVVQKSKTVPPYKQIYDNYLADMAVFKNTKTFPENEMFDKDMVVFQDGKIFEVVDGAETKISSQEGENFYVLIDGLIKN